MDIIAVGIDVSKDRLDVAVHPGGEAFVVERNGAGLEQLTARLKQLAPTIVALEATGGFETIAAAAIGSAVFRSLSSTQRRSVPLPRHSDSEPRPIRSTRR